jgi:hypothetical protein
MSQKIKLGYEVKTAKEVSIKPSHLIVTGITQLSGKTTALEAIIKRSGMKAIVFKTKIGEKSFTEGTVIPPFFKDRSDYDFIKSLIEAYAKEKLYLEKGTLMRLCQGASSLLEIKKRVDDRIIGKKMRGLEEEIYTRLQHYLESIIPQIQYANFSKVLSMVPGVNIMDLERFTEEVQSLIIQSVATEVLMNHHDIIIVIPEAWRFLPQKYNNPCKRAVESFIRQGATNNNYVFLDSQDLAGIDKQPLKQVSIYILGYQAERNEVKHTLDQISLPNKLKPKEDEIMTLKLGHFYLSSYDGVKKFYMQPIWLEDAIAIKIAKGLMESSDVSSSQSLVPYSIQPKSTGAELTDRLHADSINKQIPLLRSQLIEMRADFFNKITELQNYMNQISSDVMKVRSQQHDVDISEIASLVLQKLPVQPQNGSPVNKEEIISEVLKRVPQSPGAVTYQVAPLEKITKDFLDESKQFIISNVNKLDDEQKKMLKYIEAQGTGRSLGNIIEKCLFKSQTSGGTRKSVGDKLKDMSNNELVRYDPGHGLYYPALKTVIQKYCGQHSATEQDIQQVFEHIMMEMLK